MEVSVGDLLNRINKEGTEAALKEKESIILNAKNEASKIVSDAKAEADSIIKNAESEAKKLIAQGESSLSQSARNVRLSLKDELNEMFSKALNKSLSETLSASDYVEIIKCALSSVQDEEKTLLLSDKLFKGISSDLVKSLSVSDVKKDDALKSGFRLSINDGKAYYDFTDDELKALISPYLSDALNRIVSEK